MKALPSGWGRDTLGVRRDPALMSPEQPQLPPSSSWRSDVRGPQWEEGFALIFPQTTGSGGGGGEAEGRQGGGERWPEGERSHQELPSIPGGLWGARQPQARPPSPASVSLFVMGLTVAHRGHQIMLWVGGCPERRSTGADSRPLQVGTTKTVSRHRPVSPGGLAYPGWQPLTVLENSLQQRGLTLHGQNQPPLSVTLTGWPGSAGKH